MARRSKYTRREKVLLAKQGICWKCGQHKIKNSRELIECENCGLEIPRMSKNNIKIG